MEQKAERGAAAAARMTSIQTALAIFGMGVREAYVQHGVWFQSDPRKRLWYKCITCTNIVRDTCEKGTPPSALPSPPSPRVLSAI